MALFRVTVKQMKNTNGIRVEKGMSVEVVTNSLSNPLTTNGGQAVADAFYRIYGIDAQKAGILSTVYLDVQRIRESIEDSMREATLLSSCVRVVLPR